MVKNKSGFYASLGPRFWKNNPISPLSTDFLAPSLSGYSAQWKIPRKGRKNRFVNGRCVTLLITVS